MDFYTKLFLANAIAMISLSQIDRHIFKDALENIKGVGSALGLWALITLLSVPVWLAYLVMTW